MLKMLRQGKGVNILDLGVMYIALKGPVKGDNPDAADIPELLIKFTPSTLSNEAIKDIVIDKIVFSQNGPQIDFITDLWTGQMDSCLTPGKTCRITGDKLKLGGNKYSLELVPLDESGEEDTAEEITAIDISKVSKNTNKLIEFFIPETLTDKKSYKIRITTSYINKMTSRKVPAVKDSDALTVNRTSQEALDPAV